MTFLSCSRWGKERPLNTRLLIQNVGLPTHDVDCVPGLKGNGDDASWEVQVFRSITSDSARYSMINKAKRLSVIFFYG